MKRLFVIGLLIIGFASCNQPKSSKSSDTTTSGSICISADESLKPIVDAEKDVFEALYPTAKINVIYTGEQDAINLALIDSCRMAIVTRQLSENEKQQLKANQKSFRYSKMAYDGIAFIINKQNTDSNLSVENIKAMLDGTTKKWTDLNPKSTLGNVQVVFDNPNSGALRMLRDSLLNGKELAKNCFGLKTNPDVIDYVEKNKNAIGIIGVAWISDGDDSLMLSFYKRVRVCDIIPKRIINTDIATNKPIQANIALRQYPFWRTIYMITRESHIGLGTGFASFVAGDQGQRIILKAGLVPARAPIRIVNLTNE